ncbi:hypothetical protein H4R20_000958 [Coemansia guatemalensis]|uniref:Uncharacterized protein n=1 Tax=Coemansia guatemalensis TaxID=2761395 RepID=A0A9W8I076_9FUNG|nr:hypothetical protein H4R20_000958 [Coemansia guatemalensis]
MDTIFTFYKDRLFSKEVVVYRDERDEQPENDGNAPPEFEIKIHTRSLLILENTGSGTQELLSGTYENLAKTSALLNGKSSISMAKRKSIVSREWSFIHLSNTYKWDVKLLNREWSLHNADGNVLARFNRLWFGFKKLGRLYMVDGLDKELQAMVLLTCELVHRSVKAREVAANSGG